MFILLSIAGFVVIIAFFLVRFLMGKGAFNLVWLALVVGLAYFIYDEIQYGYMGTLLLFMCGIGFLNLLLLIFLIQVALRFLMIIR